MARYTGPVWKKSRRLSFSILETGEELKKRTYAPGQHGPTKRIKLSGYGTQLREKQRVRNMYGINERQFYNTFVKASNMDGMAGLNFLLLLESRLDNLVYRMGFARTRKAARQLVNHGHIEVNGKKVDIPSAQIKPGSVIAVREKSRSMKPIAESLDSNYTAPAFVNVDKEARKGTFVRLPERSELNQEINESLIVEYYNR
ncbi:30S ribosomal protein S4 [Erysipelotrichaceae bacterium Oil+RF-744-GAM-WT-6]|jgi:small subunit ribosomal protein S4|uniref:Small ribosomal subunit protein uS4 n=1 Tax=Stecheria intestinalis TaxID=2606630 RepID=A0A7X2TFE9_9FIRM|nr:MULTISPECIES: 30S ribosomal protein S4 [Erysipelotrichaceae]MCI2153856.1 30S ribosomal protein S4 [Solobacterium sp.]MDY3233225.1 30S ribosomal protein S4 [Erysipelotrichaceae bacterium]MDY4680696.1 30S ribosomal protein S4 [Lachnospiraceae bacterium]MCI6746302.1 30S ribosomal protein S4 [Anaerolactibacter massiliensis]MDD5880734.1 30S ribosomal protein S4 [Stecheria intestinalis]